MNEKEESRSVTYSVVVFNPLIGKEVMRIETEIREIAESEAEFYSRRHGLALVTDNSTGREVSRYRYGIRRDTGG